MKYVLSLAVWMLLLAVVAPSAWGQIRLEAEQASLGFEGYLYPGLWTPVRVGVENTTGQPLAVRLTVPVRDSDGDQVQYQRVVTVDANRTADAWLYVMSPQSFQTVVEVRAANAETGASYPGVQIRSASPAVVHAKRVLVLSTGRVGLEDYVDGVTRHEPVYPIEGLTLRDLPDRAHGLDAIDAVVWAPGGGDPATARWTPAQQNALRGWVRRGGHLVLILPSAGQTWGASSLADVLPVDPRRMERVTIEPPRWLGRSLTSEPVTITATAMIPKPGSMVLHELEDGRATLVAGTYGFGRVTVLGADVTDIALRRIVADDGSFRVWQRVFGWQAPVRPKAWIEQQIRQGEVTSEDSPVRVKVTLDEGMSAYTDLRRAVGPWLNLLLILLAAYWAVAGPLSYLAVRQRQRTELAWLAFAVCVVVFSLLSWVVIAFAAPAQTQVRHLTVLDVDARARIARVNGWASAFTPEFGRVAIRFGHEPIVGTYLSSPGWPGAAMLSFIDARPYPVEADDPSGLGVPSRSAARMVRYETMGRLDDLGYPGTFYDTLTLVDGLPSGTVRHEAPAPIRYVRATFLPFGETADRAITWAIDEPWVAGESLAIAPENAVRLVNRPGGLRFDRQRSLRNEGHLGGQLSVFPTQDGWLQTSEGALRPRLLAMLRVLTFYDLLPAPRFHQLELTDRAKVLRRGQLKRLDLSQNLLPGRLILTGLIEGAELPAPLLIGGQEPSSSGMTAVRIVYDLTDASGGAETR